MNLTKQDIHGLSQWFSGVPITTEPTSPAINRLVRTLNPANNQHLEIMTEVCRPILPEILAADPMSKMTNGSSPLVNFQDAVTNFLFPDLVLPTFPIYKNSMNAIFAPGGNGKTFIALYIAFMLSMDNEVVYIASEAQAVVKARMKALSEFNKLQPESLYLWEQPLEIMNDSAVSEFINTVGHKVELVVLDTFAHSMTGGDENQTRDVQIAVNSCFRIIRELNCAMLVTHHTSKEGQMRGNLHLYNSCDSVLRCIKDDNVITLFNNMDKGGKNRNAEEAEPIYMTLLPYMVTDSAGREFSAAVAIPSSKVEMSPAYGLRRTEQQILEMVEGYEQGLTITEIIDSGAVAKSSAYRRIKELVQADYLLLSENGKYVITENARKLL